MARVIAHENVARRRTAVRVGKVAAQPAVAAEHGELLVRRPRGGARLRGDGEARMTIAVVEQRRRQPIDPESRIAAITRRGGRLKIALHALIVYEPRS